MSRIGKSPVTVPAGVKVSMKDAEFTAEGPKGKMSVTIVPEIQVKVDGDTVNVVRLGETRQHRAFHGLFRTLVNNAVVGVSTGFTRILEINGVGYRAAVQGDVLNLSMGFSHPVAFKLPKGIDAAVEKQTRITLSGYDKQVLGETAAKIRAVRPPEPYKGKGIKYAEEVIQRKAGKAAGR